MRPEECKYHIQYILDMLKEEGVESVYDMVKSWKYDHGSSAYSGLVNDLIAHCPNGRDWKDPAVQQSFIYDVKYYCNYWLNRCHNDS